MIDNWFKPLGKKDLPNLKSLEGHTFAKMAGIFLKKPPSLEKAKVAIFGVNELAAREIRKYLYPLSFPFSGLEVVDLGNARRHTDSFLIQTVKELLDSNILPVMIGADPATTLSQAKAFLQIRSNISLVIADEKPPLSIKEDKSAAHYLNPLIHGKHGHLFHLGLLGMQGHFINPDLFSFFDKHNFDVFRLGQARDEMEGLEPIVRDADHFSFNLSCIKESEAPEVSSPSPSGFTTEEACRLSRYAGMSDKLKSFGLFGYEAKENGTGCTARVAAQLIWYFLDGIYNRKNDFPASMDGLMEYIVDVPSANHQLVFWKSEKSGRWWMQVPVSVSDEIERHRLVPCTFQDYQTACDDDLPIRLMQAISRFT